MILELHAFECLAISDTTNELLQTSLTLVELLIQWKFSSGSEEFAV